MTGEVYGKPVSVATGNAAYAIPDSDLSGPLDNFSSTDP